MAVRFDADAEDYTRALALGSQSALTVACWFKLSADRNTWSSIFFIDSGQVDNWGMQTAEDGVTMNAVMDASTREGMGALTVGTWYFACLATSGTTGALYYKTAAATALTTQAITGASAVTADTLRLGESPWGGEWLNGCLTAVRVWNAQLSSAEAQIEATRYVPNRLANLVAFYPLVKPEATDYSGNARTLSGGASTTTEDGPPLPWRITSPRVVRPASAAGVSGSALAYQRSATASTVAKAGAGASATRQRSALRATGLRSGVGAASASARCAVTSTGTAIHAGSGAAAQRPTTAATGRHQASAAVSSAARTSTSSTGRKATAAAASARQRSSIHSAGSGATGASGSAHVGQRCATESVGQKMVSGTASASARVAAAGVGIHRGAGFARIECRSGVTTVGLHGATGDAAAVTHVVSHAVGSRTTVGVAVVQQRGHVLALAQAVALRDITISGTLEPSRFTAAFEPARIVSILEPQRFSVEVEPE